VEVSSMCFLEIVSSILMESYHDVDFRQIVWE